MDTYPEKKAVTAEVMWRAVFAFAPVVASTRPPAPKPFKALYKPRNLRSITSAVTELRSRTRTHEAQKSQHNHLRDRVVIQALQALRTPVDTGDLKFILAATTVAVGLLLLFSHVTSGFGGTR